MNLVRKYFPDLDENAVKKFSQLMAEFPIWNNKINLVSRKDIAHLEERHILHSLAIAKYTTFLKGTQIIDVGTGGGFPGIPLAIFFPDCQFTLIDAIQKKTHAVEEIAKSLELSNIVTIHGRMEKTDKKYDFVVNRAVTAFPRLVGWTKNMINEKSFNAIKNGIITLKGGDLQSELSNYKKQIDITPVKKWYDEDWFEKKYIIHWYANLHRQ